MSTTRHQSSPRHAPRRVAGATLAVVAVTGIGCGPGDAPEASRTPPPTPAVVPDLPPGAEALSRLGTPLVPPTPSDAALETHGTALDEARAALAADPADADARIWAGRRLGYLGRYREAIEEYTEGMRHHPEDARFYRHRGHRYITVRQFADAVADFNFAVELFRETEDQVEPDGLPNAAGIPLSTLQFNTWYHKGLAHYLMGDLNAALAAYEACMDVSVNPDLQVATAHWMYMTLRELGRDDEAEALLAPFSAETEVIENASYRDLLLLYRGEMDPEALLAGQGEDAGARGAVVYGVGNWFLLGGDPDRAYGIFQDLVDTDQWGPFGYIAAEVKLARRDGT